jgi:2-methylcitrate dehydratase
MVAGIGAMLRLPVESIYQALNHAVHVTLTTRQSRKGEISTWKANAPAHAGRLAVEAVDRAMWRDVSGPDLQGDDSIIAWMLHGRREGLAAQTESRPVKGGTRISKVVLSTVLPNENAE